MKRKRIGTAAILIIILPTLHAQDAQFAADNLKYSHDFYSKVHFVAIASSPASFKYDRYPSGGPERIQCDDGTYTRQHAKSWVHSNDKMRRGLPIDYPERSRYVMTFALTEDWGRTGEPVDKETARKLDGWVKLAEAALSVSPANAKLLNKSETTDRRAQWVFEAPSENRNGVPARFTFRKPLNDKNENVLLHEFSGPLRPEGNKGLPEAATDTARFGFGYMMPSQQGYEVSEFAWEEMQQAREENGASSGKEAPGSPAAGSSPDASGRSSAAQESPLREKKNTSAPTTEEDFFNSAQAKRAAGDLDGAIADYNRAIRLNPKESAAYNNRRLAKEGRGDLNGAIADYSRAVQLNPKDAFAYNNRGNAKAAKGDFNGAIADYDRAIRLDPKYANAYYDRGLAKKKKNDFAGAISDYNRVIELDPKMAKAYCDRGVAKRRKGDLDGAIIDYDRGIELDPEYAIAYHNRGNAKDDKGDLNGAIADYTRAIELAPKYGDAYYHRASVWLKKKQYDAATKDLQKAIELDPQNGQYYLNLAWYQLFNRKPRESIAASLKALELSPDDTVMIKTNLAHGYLFDNQFDKAKTIYLENKNAKIADDKRSFGQAVRDDFKEFRDAGITHPDMEKIQALLINPSSR